MKFFDHLYIPEQIVPVPGLSPMQQLVEELMKIRQDARERQQPDYFLDNLLNRLNDSFLKNKEKQAQLKQLTHKLSQKYGAENVDFSKLKDGLLTFFLAKSVRDILYTPPPRPEQASHEEILLEYQDFLSYREAKNQLEGQKVKKATLILEGSSLRPTLTDYSGIMEKKRKSHFGLIDNSYEKISSTFCSLGFTVEEVKAGFEKLLHFELDILLYHWAYADFYSFISKEAISKTARYEVMYDIFLITHELTPAGKLRAFRDLDEEYLAKDPEYRTHKLGEVRKILYKKGRKHSVQKSGGTPREIAFKLLVV
jgi:hypothetical protein